MIKAMRECLKNWLIQHERLYWYIVIGLAVFGFGLATAMGCAKLHNANAAQSLTVPWAGGEELSINNTYSHYLYYVYEDNSEIMYVCFFANSPIYVQTKDTHRYVIFDTSGCCYLYRDYKDSHLTDAEGFFDYPSGNSSVSFGGILWKNVHSNHDILERGTSDVVFYSEPFIMVEYFGSAPYFTDVTYSNVNLFLIDGNTDFDESTFRFVFDIADDGLEYVSRTAKMSGYVYLPSKEFITKAAEYYLGGRDTLDAYYSIYSCAEYPNWLNSLDVGDGSTYKKWNFAFDVECGDSLDLSLTHEQIYSLIEEYNDIDLREYYGISDVAYIDHILKGYMWVYRLDGYIYTTYSDIVRYGNMTSFVLSAYLKDPIVVVGNSDPNFVGPMLPDSDIQNSLSQAYKDALDEAIKENEALNDSYSGLLDTSGAYGDLEGSDLWTSFRSLSDGLASMAPAVRAIALLSGSVLAFMPLQVQGMISFTLVALCIIAIIKAIRG